MKKSYFSKYILVLAICFSFLVSNSQNKYMHEDSLKGKVSKEREWWNVLHYDLWVTFNPKDSTIIGYNVISYQILSSYNKMQLDLMEPLVIDSIIQENKKLNWKLDGAAFFITLISEQKVNSKNKISVYYHGKPKRAKLPPWDGGVIWSKDTNGNPWISVACQGMGPQVWFPNKDHQYDEPDSAGIHITAPKELITVSNGRLRSKQINNDGTATFYWAITNPINNYNIVPYIGKYVNFNDTLNGVGGTLDLNYWVLENNLEKAQMQFAQVKSMLRCFENWFGKYPFYEDSYKLVEAPHLGMEHQSAVAYGNKYVNGYLGRDLSGTGWGLKWDFIIVHESGHEWFGNNITVKDVADNWVHEGFTAYSENLFTEYLFGKEAGAEYVIGTRKAIQNDEPIIADYDVNRDGSGDMYYKASNMLHTIRQIVNNDSLWKALLRDINKTFWHQTVTSKQIEEYMIGFLKLDLQKIFNQYLRTTKIPILEYKINKQKLKFRWTNCVKGFNLPIKINTLTEWIVPTEEWQSVLFLEKSKSLEVNKNIYIKIMKVK